ncbi:MAG TPA: helix-turn-helix domain-containing protein [Oligoflexia bacterium]|nr:helix-turn-helix domain-containing protein [Oligoflexia bacterium]
MDANLAEQLSRFGLSRTEAQVYLTALRIGGGYVSAISREAQVERTNCYHILNTLSEKGLISVSNRGSYKFYLPESPKKLVEESKQRFELAQQLLPGLLEMASSEARLAPKMRYYEGAQSIAGLLRHRLESNTEILAYTNIARLINKFPGELRSLCTEQAKRKIKCRMISPHHRQAESFLKKYFPGDYVCSSPQLLLVNPKEFFLNNDVAIYGDAVSMISLHEDENFGVLIESEVYAATSRTIFDLSWLGATSFIAH